MNELASKVLKLTQSKSRLVFKDLPKDDPKRRKPDISLAIKNLDWKPEYDLDFGLNKTIEFLKIKIYENFSYRSSWIYWISLI